jgi:hypothetical protein
MKKLMFLFLFTLGAIMLFAPKYFNYDPTNKHFDFRAKIFPGCSVITEIPSGNEIELTPVTLNATCDGPYTPTVYDVDTLTDGWTATGIYWWGLEAWDMTTYDTPPAFFIPMGSGQEITTTLYYDIDLLGEGISGDSIDAGSLFTLDFKQASLSPSNGNPYGKVILYALNSSKTSLSSSESNYKEITPYDEWSSESVTLNLPSGTRYVRISLYGVTENKSGGNACCMFDTLEPKISF